LITNYDLLKNKEIGITADNISFREIKDNNFHSALKEEKIVDIIPKKHRLLLF